ncbi:hypothetical protein NIIDMKKI_05620 [Mycobacterium kansasii]|uniref:ESX-1 secretion-associated protein EspA/EspE-like domain-containing protein n=1 Tax=Mycobacterium kansasii TaxID=1768 RepID=A0A7G1I2U8_MYCKA|nr:hypothetical protein NIIDMKKI_05620 [Mycobacterium kansasii]
MGSGTELCDKTTKIISGILLSMGSGVPDPGDIFTTGSSLLRQVSDKMELAIPGANWIGASAAAYSSQNLAQQLRTKAMSDIDKLAGNLVSNQARHIRDARKVLSAMITMVNGVRKACKKLEKVPLVGKGLSLALAVPPCGTAMSVVGGALLYLTLTTMNNVMNLKGLLGRLIEMLTALPKFAGLPKLPIPGLPEIAWPPKLPEIPIPGLPSIPGCPNSTGHQPQALPTSRCRSRAARIPMAVYARLSPIQLAAPRISYPRVSRFAWASDDSRCLPRTSGIGRLAVGRRDIGQVAYLGRGG